MVIFCKAKFTSTIYNCEKCFNCYEIYLQYIKNLEEFYLEKSKLKLKFDVLY